MIPGSAHIIAKIRQEVCRRDFSAAKSAKNRNAKFSERSKTRDGACESCDCPSADLKSRKIL
jgi:hypothetical protein